MTKCAIGRRFSAAIFAAGLCAVQVAAASLQQIQNDPNFPRIRESVEYSGIDWESGDRVRASAVITDDDPVLDTRIPAPRIPGPVAPASIEPYDIDAQLNNVSNREAFGEFSAEQTKRLHENGFVVTTDSRLQSFYIYE